MIGKKLPIFFILINLIVINGVILAVMNIRYPIIGHDYTLALPSLLDLSLHYRLNGLAIQWFTPTFGGGIPIFPNPNTMQYSIPAVLAVFLPPWQAVMLAVIIQVTAGFLACYYILYRLLDFHWTSSILGAVFFSASGFMITRVATGQLGYFSFPLLPLFLILLLDNNLSLKLASILFGLLVAFFIYSAGYFIIIIFVLSILITLPVVFLIQPGLFQARRLLIVIFVGGVIGGLISLSKLAAAYSFMSHFPRLVEDQYSTTVLLGLFGIALQLLGTPTLVPLFLAMGMDPGVFINYSRFATGSNYDLWELDISLTPIVFVFLIIGTVIFLAAPRKFIKKLNKPQQIIALGLSIFFTYLALEFILARGVFYPILRNLPVLSSLRGNVRFTGALLFPLMFMAIYIYHRLTTARAGSQIISTYMLVNLIAVLPLASYFLFNHDMFLMTYDVRKPQSIFNQMNTGESFEVTHIGVTPFKNTGALLYRTSNLNVYEPVFGFKLENFHPQVKPGSVWEISGDHYNLTDPTGFVYPELNNNKPFDRFRVTDKAIMEKFVKHLQPEWNIPTYQRILNWLSGTTLLAALVAVVAQIYILWKKTWSQ